jgi:hypothetical protein
MFIIQISFAFLFDHINFGIIEQISNLCQIKYTVTTGIPGQIKPRIIAKQAAIRSKTKD